MAAPEHNEIERLIGEVKRLTEELDRAESELARAIESNLRVLARMRLASEEARERT